LCSNFESEDYSTDEEYLNTIAGADADESKDELERMMKEFQFGDVDGSGSISLSEFIKLSRNLQERAKNTDVNQDFAPNIASRLDQLERKLEENNKTLRRLCVLLEASLKAKNI
jgi:Ca2+-binding EF-hand superfamily protein